MRLRFQIKTILLFALISTLIWTIPVQAASVSTSSTTTNSNEAVIEASVPVEYAPPLISESAVLIDADSGQILYGKNMDEVLYPASITKIMTSLLALERGNLNDILTMSHDAVYTVERGSSHIALEEGEQISLNNALYGLAIASANDAANGIAEYIGGSIPLFADMMNQRAQEAGALNTHFTNANGLPDPTHLTTARDMALITRAAVNTPGWTTYFGAGRYEIPPTNLQPEVRALYSYNSFLNGERHLDGVIGCKTGYTNEAFHTLVTVVRRNGRTLIAVVMKSQLKSAKWDDTEALIEYGFAQFRAIKLDSAAFPQEIIEVSNEAGDLVEATLQVTEPVLLWLHQTVKLSDLQLTLIRPHATTQADLDQTKVKITIGGQYADRMSAELIDVQITPQFASESQTTPDKTPNDQSDTKASGISSWLVAFLIIFLTFGLILIAAILYAIRQRNLKRRRRRERLANLRRNYLENQKRYR
ncbi:MAG: D-alanyl-D-alanine carboxypeptidase [Eubacteriales bacterium]|nr:D-alanyl-D-alanine carboxypeptidase [Eubacteriales bacterium]